MKNFLIGWKSKQKRRMQFSTLFVLMLVSCLKASTAQVPATVHSASSHSVNPLFLPVVAQLKQKHPGIPILLPTFIARQKQFGPLAAGCLITQTSYAITLDDALKRPISRDFPFPAYYCSINGQTARTRQAPHDGKRVVLADGITGWYTPSTSNSPDTGGVIGWRYKTGDYSMGLVQGTEAELVAMANSAIQRPVQLQPVAPSCNTDFVDHTLRFRRGSDVVVINGTMTPGVEMDTYTFNAHEGQTIEARLKSPDKRVFFYVMNPSWNPIYDDNRLYWYRPVKVSGRYDLRVIADKYGVNKTSTYTLQVKLSGR